MTPLRTGTRANDCPVHHLPLATRHRFPALERLAVKDRGEPRFLGRGKIEGENADKYPGQVFHNDRVINSVVE